MTLQFLLVEITCASKRYKISPLKIHVCNSWRVVRTRAFGGGNRTTASGSLQSEKNRRFALPPPSPPPLETLLQHHLFPSSSCQIVWGLLLLSQVTPSASAVVFDLSLSSSSPGD